MRIIRFYVCMKVTFAIKYRADWGQKLCISGSIVELGCWDEGNAIELCAESEGLWTGTVSIDGRRKDFSYYYLVKDQSGQVLRREWKRMHRLKIKEPFQEIYMDDHWINRPANAPFYSSAFYDVLFRHQEVKSDPTKRHLEGEKVILQVYAPTVPRDHKLYLSGSTIRLGQWRIEDAIPMAYLGKGEWQVSLSIDRSLISGHDVWFKFLIADEQRRQVRWEAGDNHHFVLPPHGQYDAIYVAGMNFDEGEYAPHFAGVVSPVFSLRSRQDWGSGDFGALRQMVDWASQARLHLLQILPINDTIFYRDWRDSYPYNAISVDALHPIYMDVSALPPLKDATRQAEYEHRAEELRQSETLLYPEVVALKEEYLYQHYLDYGQAVMSKKPFRSFVQQQIEWLTPYTAFCLLRDLNPGQHYRHWGGYASYSDFTPQQLLDSDEHRVRAGYYRYVQFLLSEQLISLREYAEERGVLLKGDIPIGVSPLSVETWVNPQLFHLERSAGAPPDNFAIDGQNWGFPTYNWEQMARDRMLWWRRRFERMSIYFKAFRIDHILGFFRIWEIPRTQFSGLLGHFSPAYPLGRSFWEEHFGRWFDLEAMTFPCIHSQEAEQRFGFDLETLVDLGILIPSGAFYRLRYVHQQEVATLDPEQLPQGEETRRLLVELCKEIALVEDMNQPRAYHPRISFQTTRLYAHWPEEARRLWDQISHHHYYQVHNELWKRTALQRLLPLLESTDMLVCAEDLGMIPSTVPEVLNELQILTLDLERMPKEYIAQRWTPMGRIPYLSICTTSTHDMPPLRLWWEQSSQTQKKEYLATQLPDTTLEADSAVEEVMTRIVEAHLASPAMFVVLPIADWMSIDSRLHLLPAQAEQINHPENPLQHWEYRLPVTLEDLCETYSDWTERIAQHLYDIQRD